MVECLMKLGCLEALPLTTAIMGTVWMDLKLEPAEPVDCGLVLHHIAKVGI